MSDAPAWGPSASLQVLATRANMLAAARAFFRALNVQEVDIPALSPNTLTDAQIASLKLAPGAYGQAPVFPQEILQRSDPMDYPLIASTQA